MPQLEVVGQMRSVSMSPDEAPSVIAMKRVGKVFEEFKSDSSAMIVLEGEQPLGDDAHRFYNDMVAKLEADTKYVEHVQDFWGDPLTEAGAQSNDGKAAYVQVYLAGNQGEALANESVEARAETRRRAPSPAGGQGLRDRRFGAGGRSADRRRPKRADHRVRHVRRHHPDAASGVPVDRHRRSSCSSMVFLGLSAARGAVAFLGYHDLIGLSTFATNLLVDPGDRRLDRLRDLPHRALSGGPHR